MRFLYGYNFQMPEEAKIHLLNQVYSSINAMVPLSHSIVLLENVCINPRKKGRRPCEEGGWRWWENDFHPQSNTSRTGMGWKAAHWRHLLNNCPLRCPLEVLQLPRTRTLELPTCTWRSLMWSPSWYMLEWPKEMESCQKPVSPPILGSHAGRARPQSYRRKLDGWAQGSDVLTQSQRAFPPGEKHISPKFDFFQEHDTTVYLKNYLIKETLKRFNAFSTKIKPCWHIYQ